MKKFMGEFKTFIMRGNVLDLAVGVIVGAAFQNIVTALTDNIISPVLGLFGGVNFDEYAINVADVSIAYGKFITAVINFIIMAFIVFLIVKGVNKIMTIGKKEEAPAEPTTKECPFCMSEISIKAVKCPHCTSDILDKVKK